MNAACQNDLEIVQVSHYINDEIKFIFAHSTYITSAEVGKLTTLDKILDRSTSLYFAALSVSV